MFDKVYVQLTDSNDIKNHYVESFKLPCFGMDG